MSDPTDVDEFIRQENARRRPKEHGDGDGDEDDGPQPGDPPPIAIGNPNAKDRLGGYVPGNE